MTEGTRYFQYIAGDRKGEVVVFDRIESDEDATYVVFKDNSRCNEELILPINNNNWEGMYMAEVENSKNIWKFKEEWVGRQEEVTALNAEQERVVVQPFMEGRKKVTPIPPKKSVAKFGAIDRHIEPVKLPEPEPKKTDDPVHLMVDKSKKFDTEVSLEMIISLPKASLYAVVDESFENGGKKMVDYIVDNMEVSIIKDALRKSLLEAYGAGDVEEDAPEEDDKYNDDSADLFEPEIVEEPIIGQPVATGPNPFKEEK